MIPAKCEANGCHSPSTCVMGFAGEFPSMIAVCDECRRDIFEQLGAQPCSPVILPIDHPHAEKTYHDFEQARQKSIREAVV